VVDKNISVIIKKRRMGKLFQARYPAARKKSAQGLILSLYYYHKPASTGRVMKGFSYMRRRLCLLVCMLMVACMPLYALITVSRDTTWGPDSVKITDNVRIGNGITLTVAPGSHMVFSSGCGLQVQGRLLAAGTPADSISFNVESGSYIYWNGIRFIKTPWTNDTSKLVYCTITGIGASMMTPGAVAVDSFSKLIITHSTIQNNGGTGSFYGGGMNLRKANPILINDRIVNNKADGSMANGGGIYCLASNPVIINTLFYQNSSSGAAAGGGAMYLSGSSPLLVNCTFVKNKAVGAATFGAGIYCLNNSNPKIINTIFWGNQDDQAPLFDITCAPVFKNCVIQGGSYLAVGSKAVFDKCMGLDPRFTKDSIGDFSLLANSPCINMGLKDTTGLGLPPLDLADNPRIAGTGVDIGAYEFQGTATAPQVISVSPNGGEVWTAGSSHSVTFTAVDNGTIVAHSIWLSIDNGVHFARLDSATAGFFSWNIPLDINSNQCLIGVCVYDNDGNAGWGVSNSVFTIQGTSGILEGKRNSIAKGDCLLFVTNRASSAEMVFEFNGAINGRVSLFVSDASGRELWKYKTDAAGSSTSVTWRYDKNSIGNGVVFVKYAVGKIFWIHRIAMLR
jgi:hypothetical protein